MAQNTVEDTKSAVDKTEMSEKSTDTIDKADSHDDKENADEMTDVTNAESAIEESKESDKKDKVDDNSTDTPDVKEQLNAQETNLNEKPKEETDPEKESSSEKIIRTETKENEAAEEECPTETTNDVEEQVNAFCAEAEEQLNEILKVVHEDLKMEYFQKSSGQSTSVKDDGGDTNGDEQQTNKVESEEALEEHTTEEDTTEIATVQDAEEKKDSRESPEKSEEKSEVGIVGPPTAVSELINEEELGGGDSAEQKDHIAEWVEKSAKEDTSAPANVEDEVNVPEEDKQETNGNEIGTKWKNEDAMSISSRKSQKIVSNIIKKSIKW